MAHYFPGDDTVHAASGELRTANVTRNGVEKVVYPAVDIIASVFGIKVDSAKPIWRNDVSMDIKTTINDDTRFFGAFTTDVRFSQNSQPITAMSPESMILFINEMANSNRVCQTKKGNTHRGKVCQFINDHRDAFQNWLSGVQTQIAPAVQAAAVQASTIQASAVPAQPQIAAAMPVQHLQASAVHPAAVPAQPQLPAAMPVQAPDVHAAAVPAQPQIAATMPVQHLQAPDVQASAVPSQPASWAEFLRGPAIPVQPPAHGPAVPVQLPLITTSFVEALQAPAAASVELPQTADVGPEHPLQIAAAASVPPQIAAASVPTQIADVGTEQPLQIAADASVELPQIAASDIQPMPSDHDAVEPVDGGNTYSASDEEQEVITSDVPGLGIDAPLDNSLSHSIEVEEVGSVGMDEDDVEDMVEDINNGASAISLSEIGLGTVRMTNDNPHLFWTVDFAMCIMDCERHYAAKSILRLSKDLSDASKCCHTPYAINEDVLNVIYNYALDI